MSLEEVARERKEEESPLLSRRRRRSVRSQGCVLLRVKVDERDLVGLICVADDRVRDAFTPEEITLLETVASQIGVAIANSRIYSRMKERDRLATLGAHGGRACPRGQEPPRRHQGGRAAARRARRSSPGRPDRRASSSASSSKRSTASIASSGASSTTRDRPRANPVPLDINAAVRRTIQILSSQLAEPIVDLRLELHEPHLTRAYRPRAVSTGAHQPRAERGAGDGRRRARHREHGAARRIARATWATTAAPDPTARTSPSSDDGADGESAPFRRHGRPPSPIGRDRSSSRWRCETRARASRRRS